MHRQYLNQRTNVVGHAIHGDSSYTCLKPSVQTLSKSRSSSHASSVSIHFPSLNAGIATLFPSPQPSLSLKNTDELYLYTWKFTPYTSNHSLLHVFDSIPSLCARLFSVSRHHGKHKTTTSSKIIHVPISIPTTATRQRTITSYLVQSIPRRSFGLSP